METYGREPTQLEFFKATHSVEGGGFVANTATEDCSVYVLILLLVIFGFLFLWSNYDIYSISS